MKAITTAAFLILLASSTAHAATSADAQQELAGWGRAARAYEEKCGVGALRQQMPPEKAEHAYKCFAAIMDREVEPDLQYPDLYKTLDEKMEAAHMDYAAGNSTWPETLDKLAAASDEYNAAVALRNSQGSTNN
jgi:hypothetical protein